MAEKSPALALREVRKIAARDRLILLASLVVNIVYVVAKLYLGIRDGSSWDILLAVYYCLLAVMRFALYIAMKDSAGNMPVEYKRSLFCGVAMLVLNLLLTILIATFISNPKEQNYSNFRVVVMAIYTLFLILLSVYNFFRFRTYKSPLLFAAKSVSAVAALVSMLIFEVAMLEKFGAGIDFAFRTRLIAVPGVVVCGIALLLSAVMIIRGVRGLAKKRV